MSTGNVTWLLIMSEEARPRLAWGSVERSSSTVRRALFGPIDHDENRKFVREELAKIKEQAEKDWNFDFLNDKPLPGRFKWIPCFEAAGEDDGLASATTKVQLHSAEKCGSKSVQRHQLQCRHHESLPRIVDAVSPSVTVDAERTGAAPASTPESSSVTKAAAEVTDASSQTQTKITDFMKKRKRSDTSKMLSSIEQQPKNKVQRTS